jgi:uncharacterized protein (TIGR02001 family)
LGNGANPIKFALKEGSRIIANLGIFRQGIQMTRTYISTTWKSIAAGVAGALSLASAQAADLGGSIKDAGAPKAEEKRRCTLSANVALASQYVFRGFSQTGEHAALQGGIDATCGRFYAGFWGSNLDFGGRIDPVTGAIKDVADIEIDWYAGIKHDFGRAEVDLGVIYYSYPAAFDRRFAGASIVSGLQELDYVELKLSTKWKVRDDFTITTTGFYSPEYTNRTGNVFTGEAGFEYTLPKIGRFSPAISALLGYQAGDDNRYKALIGNGSDNYLYWNAGVTIGFHEKFSLDLRYWDTNIDNNSTKLLGSSNFCDGKASGGVFQCDGQFVATLKATW